MKKYAFIAILLVILTSGSYLMFLSKDESVSFDIREVDRIEVVDGTSGESMIFKDKDLLNQVRYLINQSTFTLATDQEETTGWKLGIKIYYEGKHHWYIPSGVDQYKYKEDNFFKVLLQVLDQDKEVELIQNYLD